MMGPGGNFMLICMLAICVTPFILSFLLDKWTKQMAKLSDSTEVSLPLRNMISLIAGASVATWAYFGIVERLNQSKHNKL